MKSFSKPLQFITGKGGVGKTTVSALIAKLHARQVKGLLLVDLDPQGALPHLFEKKKSSYEPLQLAENIEGLVITPFEALKEYAGRQLKIQKIADFIIDNPVIHFFLDATPGVEEIAIMGKIYYLSEEKKGRQKRWDIIIVDAPATGHGLYFFKSPKIFIDITQRGHLRTHVEKIYSLFVSKKKTAIHLVCLPEELPVQETIELFRSSKDLGLPIGETIMNKILPPVSKTSEVWEGKTISSLATKLEEAFKHYQIRSELQATYVQALQKEISSNVIPLHWFLEKPAEVGWI